jgi:DNA-binding XRE family transcriptional regulator
MSVIREYRKRKKLTQEQFSKKIGVSIGTVKRWEGHTAIPTLKQAASICKILRLPFMKLYNEFKEVE